MGKLVILVLVIVVAACSSQLTITSDRDSKADFSQYKTYGWSEIEKPKEYNDPQFDNELNRRRIQDAIDYEMDRLGYKLVANKPDILVDFHISINRRQDYSINNRSHVYWQPDQIVVYDYQEGTLVVHIVDCDNDQLVWQGTATKILRRQVDKVEENIKRGVHLIFEKFPLHNN